MKLTKLDNGVMRLHWEPHESKQRANVEESIGRTKAVKQMMEALMEATAKAATVEREGWEDLCALAIEAGVKNPDTCKVFYRWGLGCADFIVETDRNP